ncbi:MAG: hypothetical protein WC612_00300 [Bdellovibrionales bacterium]|jgi:hypothetical protein
MGNADERRLEERELDDQIKALFGECVGAHLALPPRFFPKDKSARDFVTSVLYEDINFLGFTVNSYRKDPLGEEDHNTLCVAFSELWESLLRTGFFMLTAFLKSGQSSVTMELLQGGNFVNKEGHYPCINLRVDVSSDSIKRLAEATRLGEIKRLAHSLLMTKDDTQRSYEELKTNCSALKNLPESKEHSVLIEALRMCSRPLRVKMRNPSLS